MLTPYLRGLARDIRDLCRVQQRLGRDAPDVQAGAADLVLLDEGYREAQFARAQRGGVATAACAEYDDVEVLLRHVKSSLVPARCHTGVCARGRMAATGANSTDRSAEWAGLPASKTLLRGRKFLGKREQCANGYSGGSFARESVPAALVLRRARRCRGAPTGSGASLSPSPFVPTNSERNTPPTSMPAAVFRASSWRGRRRPTRGSRASRPAVASARIVSPTVFAIATRSGRRASSSPIAPA